MDRMGALSEVRDRGKSRSPEHDSKAEHAQACGSHWPPGRQEKPLARSFIRPYRKPTLVGKENSLQVNERSSVKELGKLTPYLWKKGCLSSEAFAREQREEVAKNRLKRLFTKNTGLCQRASGSIGADSCPVPEGYEEW
jgi:hypothetical protein